MNEKISLRPDSGIAAEEPLSRIEQVALDIRIEEAERLVDRRQFELTVAEDALADLIARRRAGMPH